LGCSIPATATSNVVTMTISPSVSASVNITSTPSGSVCKGTEISFASTVTNGGTNPLYQWFVNATSVSTNSTFASSNLNANDEVKLVVTSNANCVNSAVVNSNSIFVNILEGVTPIVTLSKQNQICNNDTITLTAPNSGTYLWSTGETTRSIVVNKSGIFTVEFTNTLGCVAKSDNVTITVGDAIQTSLTSPIYTGGYNVSKYGSVDASVDAAVTGGFTPYQFYWSNQTNSEDLTNVAAGNYQLVVIDKVNCKDTSYITLTSPPPMQLPRVFTPNGDGTNDYFVVKGVEVYPNTEITIYNRWGNVVFTSSDYKNEWQGQGSSGNVPDGTYFVVLNAKDENGVSIVLDGYVELRRESK
jgi:gliding motility-associated-like protein